MDNDPLYHSPPLKLTICQCEKCWTSIHWEIERKQMLITQKGYLITITDLIKRENKHA